VKEEIKSEVRKDLMDELRAELREELQDDVSLPHRPAPSSSGGSSKKRGRKSRGALFLATTSYITVLRYDVHIDRRHTRASVLSTFILSFIQHSVALGV
jgi:hypothetical protein